MPLRNSICGNKRYLVSFPQYIRPGRVQHKPMAIFKPMPLPINPIPGVVTMTDQSAKKKDDVQAFENRTNRIAIEMARLGSWECSPSHPHVYCSAQMYTLLEMEPGSSMTLEQLIQCHPSPYRAQFSTAVNRCLEKGIDFDLDLKMQTQTGRFIWVRSIGQRHPNDDDTFYLSGAIQDISRQKTAEKDLEHQKWLMQAVVENIPHMVFVKEARELRHILFNKAGEDLTGISRDDFLDKNAYDLFPEEDAAFYFQKDRAVFASGKAVDIPQENIQTKFRGQRLLHTKKIPIMDTSNAPIYLLGICEDITDRVKYQERLKQAKIKAESANQAKGQFLARMSHEIRTPMNLIIGMIDLVLESHLDEQQKHYMEIAVSSAHNLLHLINDILDFSKIEENRMALEQVPFNLMLLVKDIGTLFTYKATEKGLGFHIDMDLENHDCRLGDPYRIRQILINIIGNAVKFTDQGQIDILVRVNDPDIVEFQIKDTGVGIPDDKIDGIFESFTQAEAVTTRRYGGSGLGTTIAKKLVELMNGTISVQSVYRKGTTFTIQVPLPVTDDACAIHDISQKGEWVALKALNILVVDDIKENIELARIRLESKGHQVEEAQNGLDAIRKMENTCFDLILMDVHMPVMNGIDTARTIRQNEKNKTHTIPIIALTASIMTEEQQDCLDAGMDDVAGKPINFNELFVKIENLIPGSHRHYTDIGAPLPLSDNTVTQTKLPLVDQESGIRRWQSKTAYFRGLEHFQQDFSASKQALGQLSDAAQLDEIRQFMHKLKGLSGNLALKQLFFKTSELDEALSRKVTPDTDILAKGLDDLTAVISQTLEAINRLFRDDTADPDTETETVRPKAFTADQICNSLARARKMFKKGEFNEPEFNVLIKQLGPHIDQSRRGPLEKAAHEFDFDTAVKLIDTIKTDLCDEN